MTNTSYYLIKWNRRYLLQPFFGNYLLLIDNQVIDLTFHLFVVVNKKYLLNT